MDALTGLLLIFVPARVLGLLGIQAPSQDALVFLSWIGVFVMSVGLSYGLVFLKRRHGEAVWAFTSLARMAVAVFLTAKVLGETMEKSWLLVAVSDAAVALVQMVILRIGWWREGQR
jgi:hypothetical protein